MVSKVGVGRFGNPDGPDRRCSCEVSSEPALLKGFLQTGRSYRPPPMYAEVIMRLQEAPEGSFGESVAKTRLSCACIHGSDFVSQ